MASSDAKSLQGDDPPDSPSNNPSEPTITMPSGSHPMHMYPFTSHILPQQPIRPKRRQVKNACTNCQKACKKCDDARPCLRCVKYGISEECVDSQRKERKKGIKRGPYKKRDGRGSSGVEQSDASAHPDMPTSNTGPPPGNGTPQPPPPHPLMSPYMLPAGYFTAGQFPQGPLLKVDNGHMYTQYLAPLPQALPLAVPHGPPELDHNGYSAQPQYYPAFVPLGSPAVYPYVVPRHEGQISGNYVFVPMYATKVGAPSEMGGGDQGQSDESNDKAGGAG